MVRRLLDGDSWRRSSRMAELREAGARARSACVARSEEKFEVERILASGRG